MRKQKKLILQIPEPCSQNWADMAVVAGGRFCDRCQKKVTDISTFTDTQLAYFLQHKTEYICVRTLTTQLDRALIIPQYRSPQQFCHVALAALGLTITLAYGGQTFASPPLQQQSYFLSDAASSSKNQNNEDSIFIKGVALDETKHPLSFVHLSLTQNDKIIYATVAGHDGCFELQLPKPLVNQDKFMLSITDAPHDHVILTVQQLAEANELNIQFNRSPISIIDVKQIYTMGGPMNAPIESVIKAQLWNRKIKKSKKHKHTKTKK